MPRAQPLDRRLLVAEGFKEGVREILRIKRLLRQLRNGFLDLDCVQRVSLPGVSGVSNRQFVIAGRLFGARDGDSRRAGFALAGYLIRLAPNT